MTTHQTAQPGTLVSVPSGHSWRGPLIALGAAALVLVIAAAGALGWWLGSEDTAATTAAAPTEQVQVIDSFESALISRDPAALAGLHMSTGSWRDPHGVFSGAAAIETHLQDGTPYVHFTDMKRSSVVSGDGVVIVEWSAAGQSHWFDTDEMQPFATDIVGVFEVTPDGMISRSMLYWNGRELYNK